MSIRLKTFLGIILIEAVTLFLVVWGSFDIAARSREEELSRRVGIASALFAGTAKEAIQTGDLEALDALVEDFAKTPGTTYVRVRDQEGTVLTAAGDAAHLVAPAAVDAAYAGVTDGVFDAVVAVADADRVIGRVEMGFSTAAIDKVAKRARARMVTIAALALVLAGLFSFVLALYLTRRLDPVRRAAERIAAGDPEVRIGADGSDELNQTAKTFNALAERLTVARAELRSREDSPRNVLNTVIDGIITLDGNGRIQSINLAAEKIFGYPAAELIGRGIAILASDICDGRENSLLHWLGTKGQDALLGVVHELEGRRKDGSSFPMDFSLNQSRVGDQKLYTAIVRDITARRERERTGERAQLRLIDAIEHMPAGLVLFDSDDRITVCNSQYAAWFPGMRDLLVPGTHVEQLIRFWVENQMFANDEDDTEASIAKRLARYHDSDEPRLQALADGRWFQLVDKKLSDGGTVRIRVELTELKRTEAALRDAMERAEAASKAKSDFLAVMSHEIRTPLNGVIGMCDLLADTKLDAEQREYVTGGHRSAEALLELIDEILDFSKIEAGRLELENSPFDLPRLVASVGDILRPRAAAKNISFNISIAPIVPRVVVGDPGRLRQVLLNLATNAVKFTVEGGVLINVDADISNRRRPRLRFEVIDTGIGIAPENHGDLFVGFNTLDPSYKRKYGGTGLGLAICKKLVELMAGSIGVDSVLGEGAKFWFAVDIESAADQIGPAAPTVPCAATSRSGRLLVAEDNPTNSLVFKRTLEKAGYRIDLAANGAEAVEAVRQTRYEVVLMDVSMPDMDGLEATRIIRSLPAPECNVPIIALTAHVTRRDRERAFDAGMDCYLTKPARTSQILSAIDSLLQGTEDTRRRTDPIIAAREAVLDVEALRQLGEDAGWEAMPDLISSFLANSSTRVREVAEAVKSCDIDKIEHESHALRSSAATFGAMALHSLSGRIEDACRNGETSQALGFCRELDDARAAAAAELGDYLTAMRRAGSVS